MPIEKRDFPEFVPDGCEPQKALSVVTDPDYMEPGRVLIGLSFHGAYQNISVSVETARAFASAIMEAAADAAV